MRRIFANLAAAGILAISAMPSFATPILRLTSGGQQVTVTDNGNGDIVSDVGGIGYSGSIGNFFLTVTTGLTKPIIGDAYIANMDLNSISVTSQAGGNLRLEFTETGFLSSHDVTDFLTEIGGTILGGGGLAFNAYVDAANTAFGTAANIFSSTFTGGAFSTAANDVVDLIPNGPYSMTVVADLVHKSAGSSSFDGFVHVPEPAMVGLLGIGLLGIGLTRRRANRPVGPSFG